MDAVIVTDRWDPVGGGRERYLAEFVRSLSRRGLSVAVVVRHGIGERQLRRRIEEARQSHPAAAVIAARPVTGATHYQLHSGVYRNAYAAEREAYESTLRRACFWPALRLNATRSRLLRLEERMLAADDGPKVMVFSTRTRDEIQRAFGTPGSRIACARPGIDLGVFRPRQPALTDEAGDARGAGDTRVRLLFVGHNFVLKGLQWAMKAVAEARRHGIDAELIVAGRGRIGTFAAVARRLAIAPCVRFLGTVPRDALAELYRASDLLIHPAFYDPFPRAIVEALASGCPVVTTERCGAAEVISPGRNGFVIDDPRRVEAFAAAIASVGDRDRRAQMRAEAAAAGRRFDFEAHVEAVTAWLGRG